MLLSECVLPVCATWRALTRLMLLRQMTYALQRMFVVQDHLRLYAHMKTDSCIVSYTIQQAPRRRYKLRTQEVRLVLRTGKLGAPDQAAEQHRSTP